MIYLPENKIMKPFSDLLFPKQKFFMPQRGMMAAARANPAPLSNGESGRFDGSSDYMSANLSSSFSDGKVGTFSCWFDLRGGDAANQQILNSSNGGSSSHVRVTRNSANVIQVRILDASDNVGWDSKSTTTFTATDSFIHILASWNLATPEAYLYVNDTDEKTDVVAANDRTIDYTQSEFAIGATGGLILPHFSRHSVKQQ